MPVIYAQSLGGVKGFVPCSKVYRRQIVRSMELEDFDTVKDLFQQAHKLLWQRVPNQNRYRHRYNPSVVMTQEEYDRVAALTGPQITEGDLDNQCVPVTTTVGRRRYFGPQTSLMFKAYQKMANLQKLSYEAAEQRGFPVSEHRGIAIYAPSPFSQTKNAQGVYVPDDIECKVDADCSPDSKCLGNRCVIDEDKRQCPPFQYPVFVDGKQVENLSAHRTTPDRRWSTWQSKWYNTCTPGRNYTHGRWIPSHLRTYLGVDFHVIELDPLEWARRVEVGRYTVHRDPATDAAFFIAESDGSLFRFYKANSAFSPTLDLRKYASPVASESKAAPKRPRRPPAEAKAAEKRQRLPLEELEEDLDAIARDLQESVGALEQAVEAVEATESVEAEFKDTEAVEEPAAQGQRRPREPSEGFEEEQKRKEQRRLSEQELEELEREDPEVAPDVLEEDVFAQVAEDLAEQEQKEQNEQNEQKEQAPEVEEDLFRDLFESALPVPVPEPQQGIKHPREGELQLTESKEVRRPRAAPQEEEKQGLKRQRSLALRGPTLRTPQKRRPMRASKEKSPYAGLRRSARKKTDEEKEQ